jgi:ligand-binding SRPBCC domain-containing protein
MPRIEQSTLVPGALADVFAFFLRPANLLTLAPPELRLELVAGPEQLAQGDRVTWKGRRWGLAYTVVLEVTDLRPGTLLTEKQVQGPLRRWEHLRRFEAVPEGTRLTEQIDFEPPGGLLGLTVTAGAVEQELQAAFAYRADQLRERFGRAPGPDG